MAVPTQTRSIPQPAQTDFMPANSLNIKPSAGDARPAPPAMQPANQPMQPAFRQPGQAAVRQQQSAYQRFHPNNVIKTAGLTFDQLRQHWKPTLGVLATVGATTGGIQYLRNKRRERIRRERDQAWRNDANEIIRQNEERRKNLEAMSPIFS